MKDTLADLRMLGLSRMHGMEGSLFFQPTDEFVEYIASITKDKIVIDAGAGRGALSKKLIEKGVNAIPIDLVMYSNTEMNVYYMNAITFPYQENHIVIIARPSRGDWIENTMKAANAAGAEVIYISKPSNVELDIYDDIACLGKRIENVGQEGEVALVFDPTPFPDYSEDIDL